MQPIPDTGGGLSGFIAFGLWHLYRQFPFQGTWDWLLLFVLLIILLRLSVLFGLRSIVVWQQKSKPDEDVVLALMVLYACWDVSLIGILLWFFETPAGQTFLQGRELSGVSLDTVISNERGLLAFGWRLVPLRLLLSLGTLGFCAAPVGFTILEDTPGFSVRDRFVSVWLFGPCSSLLLMLTCLFSLGSGLSVGSCVLMPLFCISAYANNAALIWWKLKAGEREAAPRSLGGI